MLFYDHFIQKIVFSVLFFFFFGCQTGESEGSEKAIRRTARPKTRWIFEPVDSKRKAAYRMAP